jgi:glutaminyl-tRNA synthetase
VAEAEPGARFQFERQGYFIVDTVDSRPGALVFNRIIDLRDSWAKATQGEGATPARALSKPAVAPQNGRTAISIETASGARSASRDQARSANPQLAARFADYVSRLGLSAEDADILSGDVAVADFFERALAVHANAKLVANWIANEVLRELKEKPISALPFGGEGLGALVALIDTGTVSTTLAKEIFAAILSAR